MAPWIQCQCPCSRSFTLEEMYYCIKCAKPLCRFCLTEEVDSFYCRQCFLVYSQSEAATFKNKCSKVFTCPVCFNVMIMMAMRNAEKKTHTLYYCCMHCQFNTIHLDIKCDQEEAHSFFTKVQLYKGKYQKNP